MDEKSRCIGLTVLLMLASGASANDAYIAGEAPDARPANAPSIVSHPKDAEWYCHALAGVSRPYPKSLRFLEDQGAWYSPFNVAGMTGPYDIRNRHGADACRKR